MSSVIVSGFSSTQQAAGVSAEAIVGPVLAIAAVLFLALDWLLDSMLTARPHGAPGARSAMAHIRTGLHAPAAALVVAVLAALVVRIASVA